MKNSFPHYNQPNSKDCGPTCLRIIAKHYGKLISLKETREISETTREGSSLLKLGDAAKAMGFKTIGAKLSYKKLKQAPLPLIVHWDKQHFVVVYKIRKDIEEIFFNSFIKKKLKHSGYLSKLDHP
ncbi:Peptidase C39 family protein [Algoriphagus ornithinivorans]|uniref:Peptidase C39 family protein n=1 Tax=Algoriphagus ornithinivorans TaxID=226506 RepID=A0A1I5EZY2_9BACT|nr:cysteine peptidase family C39 domain-containing protein [Algoriphagus ornithinivorans]SFO17074.1 Peptidase C39 family protein [Algoriphagus ornithinivorans]